MALTDPQSLTIDVDTLTLPRTSVANNKSVYTDVDNGAEFAVTNQVTAAGRKRHTIRLNHSKIASDPFTAVNKQVSASVYLVVDAPITGYSREELKDVALALNAWLSAGSAAGLLKVLGGES